MTRDMNIVSFGGGTNSAAMIVGMKQRNIPIDLITFADTGAEFPHTYSFIEIFDKWLVENGLPQITMVSYHNRNGSRLTLEDECLNYGFLPSIAYGKKKCSDKHKIRPQENYLKSHSKCREIWKSGGKVHKYIGYDAGEERRVTHAIEKYGENAKYVNHYPLFEWGWDRQKCVDILEQSGLGRPGKSSCFFCPSMKKQEIERLWKQYPELWDRAVEIERRAESTLKTVKGLGRSWSWGSFREAFEAQLNLFDFADSIGGCICNIPCGCYDG